MKPRKSINGKWEKKITKKKNRNKALHGLGGLKIGLVILLLCVSYHRVLLPRNSLFCQAIRVLYENTNRWLSWRRGGYCSVQWHNTGRWQARRSAGDAKGFPAAQRERGGWIPCIVPIYFYNVIIILWKKALFFCIFIIDQPRPQSWKKITNL